MTAGRFVSSFWKWSAAGALMAGAAAVGVTFALADGSPSPTTYYACVNNSSGTIKMVEASTACSKNEQKIDWAQGASSSQAYVVRTGVRGFQDAGSSSSLVVAELDGLPAGSYTVTAEETTSFSADSTNGGQVTCTLTPGGAHGIDGISVGGLGQAGGQRANVVVTDGITVGEGAVVKYSCGGPGGLSSDNAVITATRVDTLTDQTISAPTTPGTLTASISSALPGRPGTCSLTVSGTSLMPGWTVYYQVNGGVNQIPFDELDSSGNGLGRGTAAMDGSLNGTTAVLYPATGSWPIVVAGTGADGQPVTSNTVYTSAACDGVQ
ncbi:MAG TPA: hypothetical protein VJQ83_13445 [Tepidiformaceae bacterium]|nr:hypothetical protein [Tepidiformaceae bacterium]